ncbi:uncharacterized protein LOC113868077 [Abrus precatorius]|uniref:Uncharacterized protein LOC113868077 n=1 Tax=Abrus precatorius TaxID=3816 RepID=A0A8B8LX19_ABRPR|nr:uncharacterized protein LOC113868077 [Abrus precatorius]
MAMGPERSKPLHNFSLPCLKWGTQRVLRCVNTHHPSSLHRRSSQFQTPHNVKNDNNVDVVPENIIGDLTVAAKKLKVSIFEDGVEETTASVAVNVMPWNLRTRRAACKAPPREEERRFFYVGCSSPSSHLKEKKKVVVVNERAKFCVSLSKEEVEHDFWALLGTRPPRRPKKRPRVVQRQLDTIFPGLWLSEITAESYKVPDVPE